MNPLDELQTAIAGNSSFMTDPNCQAMLLTYFEKLKSGPNSAVICIEALTDPNSWVFGMVQLRFLCLQVVENRLESCDWTRDPNIRSSLQRLMLSWLEQLTKNPSDSLNIPDYLKNKYAQIFSLVFIALFPLGEWPNYFQEVFMTHLTDGQLENKQFVDFYLRTLLDIDCQVADREIQRTRVEEERNVKIKDLMRERAVPDLVESWHAILSIYYPLGNDKIISACLKCIGEYICWIDLMLIANDRFVSVIVNCVNSNCEEMNEAAGDCLSSLISKGMDPSAQVDLIAAVDQVLESTNYYSLNTEADEGLWMTLAQLINSLGINLIECHTKLTNDSERRGRCIEIVEKRLNLVLTCLIHEDIEVSGCVTQFCHQYVTFLKQFKPLDASKKKFVMDLLMVCFQKYKLPDDYNHAVEGEIEAEFVQYRKEIRIILINIGLLDKEEALSLSCELVSNTLNEWRSSPPHQIELALNIAYFIGELFTTTQFASGEKGTEKIKSVVSQMIVSGVSENKHMAVMLQYFEVVSRYDKLLAQDTSLLPPVVASFLDDRGLHHSSAKVRSRVAYLFSRFVRGLKVHLQNYVEQILVQLQDLLAVLPGGGGGQLTAQDQLYLFEATGLLIVNANFSAERKKEFMEQLLNTLAVRYKEGLCALDIVNDVQEKRMLIEFLNNVMAYTFLDGIQPDRGELLDGLRQYLHRMVICLESELLPVVPQIIEKFVTCVTDRKCLYDFLVLVQQIMQKHKMGCIAMLQQHFASLMESLWSALQMPFEPLDECCAREHSYLRRSYFAFLLATVNSQCTQLWSVHPQILSRVLTSITDGAFVPDSMSQKTVMSIVKRLAESSSPCDWLPSFLTNQGAIRVCVHMSLQPGFDFDDAQTNLAFVESIMALRAVLQYFGKHNEIREFQKALEEAGNVAQIQQENILNLFSCLQVDNKQALQQTKLWFKTLVKLRNSE